MLWVLEISSIAFVIAGVVILVVDPDEWLVALASIGFFGMCTFVIGYMLATRFKESKRNTGGRL